MLRTSMPHFSGQVYRISAANIQGEGADGENDAIRQVKAKHHASIRNQPTAAFYELREDKYYVCAGNPEAQNCKNAQQAATAASHDGNSNRLPSVWRGMTLDQAKKEAAKTFSELKKNTINVTV
jgi:hypothetical protein